MSKTSAAIFPAYEVFTTFSSSLTVYRSNTWRTDVLKKAVCSRNWWTSGFPTNFWASGQLSSKMLNLGLKTPFGGI